MGIREEVNRLDIILRGVNSPIGNETRRMLQEEWMALNGFREGSDFSLKCLARGGSHDGSYLLMDRGAGMDHAWYCKRDKRAVAIVSEPYPAHWERADPPQGLRVNMPPNPFASFWFPGWTLFVVFTRKDHPEIRWLPDQLAFEKRADAMETRAVNSDQATPAYPPRS